MYLTSLECHTFQCFKIILIWSDFCTFLNKQKNESLLAFLDRVCWVFLLNLQ